MGMLKEGHKHLSGLDEVVLKNIDACKQLSTITRTSLGPNGMNKMVINHLDKLFVTCDTATIVSELEIQHPAAKILVLAGKAQQEEIGDGANLVVSFAGELLQGAEDLIRMGLHPSMHSSLLKEPNKLNVRIAKLLGGGLHNCTAVRGMVLKGDTVGSIKRIEKAKVVVIAGGVDTTATETKGTVLIHSVEHVQYIVEIKTNDYKIH
ncbi:hypothetical protein L1987_48439 [Smallanthus sonchifolius]|uniref:Uncharacterized protein n=1 Tax=Smallanthus sonchifolius TaxID=185202 RepID=A0ACB9FSV6_9ASTR|nr:hypothetical protein L1987_48439 [Smallanthus sonchifolius]